LVAYHYDRGHIDDVDVSGLTLALLARIPGNILQGNWRVAVYADTKATPRQKAAILAAHTGQLGGPLAELAPLIGEVLGVYDAPIEFDVREGKGTIRVGDVCSAEMQPYTGQQGRPTKLVEAAAAGQVRTVGGSRRA
jgi:hypothetical protein